MTERFVYLIPELVQKYEEGYILSIDRYDEIEESGVLPYKTKSPIQAEPTTPAEDNVNDTLNTLRSQPAQSRFYYK